MFSIFSSFTLYLQYGGNPFTRLRPLFLRPILDDTRNRSYFLKPQKKKIQRSITDIILSLPAASESQGFAVPIGYMRTLKYLCVTEKEQSTYRLQHY
jgi:hypothetical protein